MKRARLILVTLIVVLAAFACGRDESEEVPAETMTTEQAGLEGASDVAPLTAQTWIDDVTIGHELAADGSMATGRTGDDFAAGRPLHLAMEVGDAPPGSTVKVVWYGPGETRVGEDDKPVQSGQKYLNFSKQTKGWANGDYRAEVWIGDEKVNTQQFQIVDAANAGK